MSNEKRAEELEKRAWAITGEECHFKTARVAYCRNPQCGPCMLVDKIVTLGLAVEREAREARDKEVGECFGVEDLSGDLLLDYLSEQARMQGDLVRQRDEAEAKLGGSHD